ncbi:MAG: M15 family metallopeptidase [bacterium]|nr:M15 family metallopeptidase [bacterium]
MKISPRFLIYILLVVIVGIASFVYANKTPKNPQQLGTVIRKIEPLKAEIPKADTVTASVTAKPSTEISSGVIITEKGDEILVLINKNIRLPETYEPGDLVSIDGLVKTTHSGLLLRAEAAKALGSITKAAKDEGVNLIVLSAYRSFWSQQATFSSWVGSAGLAAAETFSARPGHSQHQLGTAVDFTAESVNLGLTENFTQSKEGAWLSQNASKFGFVLSYPEGKEAITGYTYEPWHWRYIGVENTQRMTQSGLILEEFLQRYGVI